LSVVYLRKLIRVNEHFQHKGGFCELAVLRELTRN
jgi:hypothetical protein